MGVAFFASAWKLPGCWVCALAVKAIEPNTSAVAAKVSANFLIRPSSLLW